MVSSSFHCFTVFRKSQVAGRTMIPPATCDLRFVETVSKISKNSILADALDFPCRRRRDPLDRVERAVAQLLGCVKECGVTLLEIAHALDQRPNFAPAAVQPWNIQRRRQAVALEQRAGVAAQASVSRGRVALDWRAAVVGP